MKYSWNKILEHIKQMLIENEELDLFVNTSDEDLISFHHSMGRYIRNEFKLWSNEGLIEYGEISNHPDDLSFEIIKYIHKTLKENK